MHHLPEIRRNHYSSRNYYSQLESLFIRESLFITGISSLFSLFRRTSSKLFIKTLLPRIITLLPEHCSQPELLFTRDTIHYRRSLFTAGDTVHACTIHSRFSILSVSFLAVSTYHQQHSHASADADVPAQATFSPITSPSRSRSRSPSPSPPIVFQPPVPAGSGSK